MFPVLFRIDFPEWVPLVGGSQFPIRMFGIMVILGFLAGTWVISRRLTRQGLMKAEDAFDFCFYLLATGILGSRLLYVMQNFEHFRGKFFDIFKIWEGGLVWYGGFALAALFAFWWLGKRKLPVLRVCDACALGVAIALAIGRWGCFCAGDDYGKMILDASGTPITDAAEAPWYAVQFPAHTEEAWRYQYSETPVNFREPFWLHPAQIYMSISNLFVFTGLSIVAKFAKRDGVIAASYFFLYPVGRFVVEFFRGDEDRGVDVLGTGLSFSQTFSIGMVAFGLLLLKIAYSRSPGTPPADD